MISEKFRKRKSINNKKPSYLKYDDVFMSRKNNLRYNNHSENKYSTEDIPFDRSNHHDEGSENQFYHDESEDTPEYFTTQINKKNILDEQMIKYQKRQLPPLQRYGANNPKDMYKEYHADSYWDNDRYNGRNQTRYNNGDFLGFIWKKFVITFGAISLLVCVSWIAYNCGSNSDAALQNGRVIIEPETSTFKVLPNNPGGMQIPHQDKIIYDRISNSDTSSEQDSRLLPPQLSPTVNDYEVNVDEYSIIDEKIYYIKMASNKNKDVLINELGIIKNKYSAKIGNMSCSVKTVRDKNGEKKYAILIGPIESRHQAIEIAKTLNTDCSVISVKE